MSYTTRYRTRSRTFDYRPDCSLCLDLGDPCIACDRVHAAVEPLERALAVWKIQQIEVDA